jgi:hypothetical protein
MSRIPRHFHFIFGLRPQTEPFHLVHYLCLESCLRVNRPERLTLYLHHEPYGYYWDLIRPRLAVERVPLVPAVADARYDDPLIGQKLRYAHHADFIRLEKLVEHGGVYADIDTLFIRPIPDALYENPFVIGREDPVRHEHTGEYRDSLCNALMLAEPGSAFARRWLAAMPAALDGSWSNHSCGLAARLAAAHPSEVHVEPPATFYPFMWTPADLRALLEENHPWPPSALGVHLWAHLWWDEKRTDFSPVHAGLLTHRHIQKADTTYARAARPFLPPPEPVLSRLLRALSRAPGS